MSLIINNILIIIIIIALIFIYIKTSFNSLRYITLRPCYEEVTHLPLFRASEQS